MTYKTFAAINVGSGEVSMKIYEISSKTGIREIDYVRYYIELGSDTYTKGYIEYDLVRELCDVLEGFSTKMEEYRVDSYLALGSSALIEASNCELIVDQIRVRTGLKVETIDNAQQRFLLLKSVARGMRNFEQLIDDGAAIVDMGSGSLQITIYDEGRLIYTQNLKLGSLRIREILADLEGQTDNFVNVMEDYIGNYIDTFSRLFMHERKVRHIIAVGEEMESIVKIIGSDSRKNHMERHAFDAVCGSVLAAGEEELSAKYSIPYELATVLKPAIIVYKKIIEISGAEKIWAAGCDLCDGMIVDYAERQEQIEPAHYFAEDIISYARTVAARYESNKEHTENVEKTALAIFDGIKKRAGLDQRDGILLQMACILHDCGKYVNMLGGTDYSCAIVRATEFVGLSEQEKSIIADTIKYNAWHYVPKLSELKAPLNRKNYIRMLKLAAILRLANGMDRSHRQKIRKVTTTFKEKELIIRADTIYDITLEQSTIENKSHFFEEIYGFKPVLRMKRR